MEDTVNACRRFDILPLYNFGLCDLTVLTDTIRWESNETEYLNDGKRRKRRSVLKTPKGVLETTYIEDEGRGSSLSKYLITREEELDIFEYYIDTLLEIKDFSIVTEHVKKCRVEVGEEAMDIQWSMQPFEMQGFPDAVTAIYLAYDRPEQFKRLMDKILRLNEPLIKATALGGADFVFLGAPGVEIISPEFFKNYILPYSKIVTDMAHQNGLLVYSHMCVLIEPMLTLGYYNQMGIDLFETLSEAPEGNVISISDAFSKLDDSICTRGNVGLDLLTRGSPEEVYKKSVNIVKTAKEMGRKHILAASDYLFYEIPEENVKAMCRAIQA
jgi:uroporphyrinogen-III decarboxylase